MIHLHEKFGGSTTFINDFMEGGAKFAPPQYIWHLSGVSIDRVKLIVTTCTDPGGWLSQHVPIQEGPSNRSSQHVPIQEGPSNWLSQHVPIQEGPSNWLSQHVPIQD